MTLHWWMHWFWITRPRIKVAWRAALLPLLLLAAGAAGAEAGAGDSTLRPHSPGGGAGGWSTLSSAPPLGRRGPTQSDPLWSSSPDMEEPFYPTPAAAPQRHRPSTGDGDGGGRPIQRLTARDLTNTSATTSAPASASTTTTTSAPAPSPAPSSQSPNTSSNASASAPAAKGSRSGSRSFGASDRPSVATAAPPSRTSPSKGALAPAAPAPSRNAVAAAPAAPAVTDSARFWSTGATDAHEPSSYEGPGVVGGGVGGAATVQEVSEEAPSLGAAASLSHDPDAGADAATTPQPALASRAAASRAAPGTSAARPEGEGEGEGDGGVRRSRVSAALAPPGAPAALDAASITGIALGIVVFAGLTGAVSFVLYRRRYLNKPQTLNDKCSNPDSSGYIDDSTLRENSEEMYSLDNDSFLNSLEAMTIQNYWTDNQETCWRQSRP